MVSLHFFLKARRRDARRIATALLAISQPARLDRACLHCGVLHAVDAPGQFLYFEDWDSEDELRRQLCSPRITQLLSLMEAAASPPQLEIRSVDQVRGLDYIRELREPPVPFLNPPRL